MVSYKKILPIILIVVSICTISGCNNYEKNTQSSSDYDTLSNVVESAEELQYEKIVSSFSSISILEIEDMIPQVQNDCIYFYLGRVSCLYCREFVITNKEFLTDLTNFYYIDTETMSQSEKAWLETYGVEEVPAILKSTYDKDIDLMDIQEFVELFADKR